MDHERQIGLGLDPGSGLQNPLLTGMYRPACPYFPDDAGQAAGAIAFCDIEQEELEDPLGVQVADL